MTRPADIMPEPIPDTEQDRRKAEFLTGLSLAEKQDLLCEGCGLDAWAESPLGISEEMLTRILWRLIAEPLAAGEHPEYGKFDDCQIGRIIRIHCADWINEYAEDHI